MVTYHATRVRRDENDKRHLVEPLDHRFGLTLREVATLAGLDPHDVEWAIEEEGECESEEWLICEDE